MTLEAWFGNLVGVNTDDDSVWRAKAFRDGPVAWRRRQNPITRRLAETLQQDTGVPLGSPGGKDLWAIAGSLLADFSGDDKLVMAALERCRKKPRWQELSPFVMKKEIVLQASRMQGGQARHEEAEREFYDL